MPIIEKRNVKIVRLILSDDSRVSHGKKWRVTRPLPISEDFSRYQRRQKRIQSPLYPQSLKANSISHFLDLLSIKEKAQGAERQTENLFQSFRKIT